MPESKWIITPGLQHTVDELIRLYLYLKKKQRRKVPIMIIGNRGVGKSLFVHIYRMLFEKDNPNKKVVRLNAASLTETLVDSELFGHVKGAFTDAIKDKPGLVETADLLILEEIGELPLYVQAKLLTFLEDGKFRRLGSNEEKSAKDGLQIIATTNKTKNEMRPDFYDRFIKITVPSLCDRRIDALYYISCLFPDILKNLRHWEIMTLLAYPWPGNVRELQTACLDMELFHIKTKPDLWVSETAGSIRSIKKAHTDLNYRACIEHYGKLKKSGVDVVFLEKVLNTFCLGLDQDNEKKPFAKIKTNTLSEKQKIQDTIFKTETLGEVDKINQTLRGLELYCLLFHKESASSDNLLSSRTNINEPSRVPLRTYIQTLTEKHDKLAKDIIEYEFQIKIPSDLKEKSLINMDWPDYNDEYNEWFRQVLASTQIGSNPNGAIASTLHSRVPQEHPFDMKEKDLLRAYYLYHKDKGLKVAEVARATGHPDSSFRDKLKKFQITPWR